MDRTGRLSRSRWGTGPPRTPLVDSVITDRLREIHERFGPAGVFGIVRDGTNTALTATLRDSGMAVDNFFGAALDKCQQDLRQAVTDELRHDGIEVTGFLLGTPDLGRTGEVIQARSGPARAGTRTSRSGDADARALNDTDLSTRISSSGEAAWRYRETDMWNDLVQRTETLQVALRALSPAEGGAPIQPGSESDQAPPAQP